MIKYIVLLLIHQKKNHHQWFIFSKCIKFHFMLSVLVPWLCATKTDYIRPSPFCVIFFLFFLHFIASHYIYHHCFSFLFYNSAVIAGCYFCLVFFFSFETQLVCVDEEKEENGNKYHQIPSWWSTFKAGLFSWNISKPKDSGAHLSILWHVQQIVAWEFPNIFFGFTLCRKFSAPDQVKLFLLTKIDRTKSINPKCTQSHSAWDYSPTFRSRLRSLMSDRQAVEYQQIHSSGM